MATGPIKQVTNNSDSNYCKMPDGTLIQWGMAKFDAQATGTQTVNVTYPIPFGGSLSPRVTVSWDDSVHCSDHMGYIWTNSRSLTTLTLYANRVNAGAYWECDWIAIGRWK